MKRKKRFVAGDFFVRALTGMNNYAKLAYKITNTIV
jgi:hypothetical protein